jgi:capsular polysaccharide transport system permease protein
MRTDARPIATATHRAAKGPAQGGDDLSGYLRPAPARPDPPDAAPARPGAFARLVRGKREGSHAEPEEKDGSRKTGPGPQGPRPGARPVGPKPRTRRPRARRRGAALALSFLLIVAVPLGLAAVYLGEFAKPQFASTVAFTVRTGDSGGMSDALTGIAQFAGGARSADTAILAEFLLSQTLVERLDMRLDLRRHYAEPHEQDPLFALRPEATVEDLRDHWRRVARVSHDGATGLIEVRVQAFSPEMAQLLSRELLVEGRSMVNGLNDEAMADAMRLAEAELRVAETRLAEARAALTRFRGESRITDPAGEAEGRLGVVRHLQAELARALVAEDLAEGGSTPEDTRRIASLRATIEAERAILMRPGAPGEATDYPALLARHERLTADRDFAEAAYRAALAARDLTGAAAARQSRYLAVYEQPTLPQRADHPRTGAILALGALFLVLVWSILTLGIAAMRDRR